MKILSKAYERNQSSEERLFGHWHRRQTGRPNVLEDKILKELQLARFVKYPSLFKDLGYNNKEADIMMSSLSKERVDNEPIEQSQEENEDTDKPIEEIIEQILFEREYDDEYNDSEDEEDSTKDSEARYFILKSFSIQKIKSFSVQK